MKIGFDAKRFFLNDTGLGNYSRDVIHSLLTHHSENHYNLYTPKGGIDLKTKFLKNYENYSIEYPKGLYKTFDKYWRTVALEKRLKQDDIDVFHGLSHEIPKKNKKEKKVSYAVTIHDLIFKKFPQYYPSIDRKIYDKKASYACQNADKIIAISEQTKQDIMELYNIDESRIEVVYQSCSDSFKSPLPVPLREKVRQKLNLPLDFILYVGTIEERKNLVTLIEALPKLKSDIPLVVIGKQTAYFKEVEKKLDELNLNNRVAFFQNVSMLDLPSVYQMANVFVYPSLYEGFGIPIIEALYSKTPVITSMHGCFEEAGGRYSKYVDPKSSDEIAYTIDEILHNNELNLSMKDKGYEHAQQFSYKNQADLLTKVYQEIA